MNNNIESFKEYPDQSQFNSYYSSVIPTNGTIVTATEFENNEISYTLENEEEEKLLAAIDKLHAEGKKPQYNRLTDYVVRPLSILTKSYINTLRLDSCVNTKLAKEVLSKLSDEELENIIVDYFPHALVINYLLDMNKKSLVKKALDIRAYIYTSFLSTYITQPSSEDYIKASLPTYKYLNETTMYALTNCSTSLIGGIESSPIAEYLMSSILFPVSYYQLQSNGYSEAYLNTAHTFYNKLIKSYYDLSYEYDAVYSRKYRSNWVEQILGATDYIECLEAVDIPWKIADNNQFSRYPKPVYNVLSKICTVGRANCSIYRSSLSARMQIPLAFDFVVFLLSKDKNIADSKTIYGATLDHEGYDLEAVRESILSEEKFIVDLMNVIINANFYESYSQFQKIIGTWLDKALDIDNAVVETIDTSKILAVVKSNLSSRSSIKSIAAYIKKNWNNVDNAISTYGNLNKSHPLISLLNKLKLEIEDGDNVKLKMAYLMTR